MNLYTRKEVAEKTGISFETLRYYEKFGLIKKPLRSQNNYRKYSDDDIERILFIKIVKKCGFTLKEISEIFEFIDNIETCNINTDQFIDDKLMQIEQKINDLINIKEILVLNKELLKNNSCKNFIKDSLINLIT